MAMYSVSLVVVGYLPVVVQGVLRLAPLASPSDVRPPVMYGHFCLVPRVSIHDRYYSTHIIQQSQKVCLLQMLYAVKLKIIST